MSGLLSLPVVLAVVALVTALCALAAAVLAWLAADRQARMVTELGARLSDLGDRIEITAAERAAPVPVSEIGALRDDLAILFEHVAALTSGQLDLKKIVGAAVSRQITPILERFEQADERADERNSGVHRRIELVQEQLTDVADDLAALAARPAAAAPATAFVAGSGTISEGPAPEPAGTSEDAAEAATESGFEVEDREVPDYGTDPNMAAAVIDMDRLAADGAADAVDSGGEAEPQAPLPRRTPAVFDSGRVAMMVPARRKESA